MLPVRRMRPHPIHYKGQRVMSEDQKTLKLNQALFSTAPFRLDPQNCRIDYELAHETFAVTTVTKALISLGVPEDEARKLAKKVSGAPKRRFFKCVKMWNSKNFLHTFGNCRKIIP